MKRGSDRSRKETSMAEENCTHDCSSCSASCGERKVDFAAKPNAASRIRKVIAVASGKGGVGKSFVTTMVVLPAMILLVTFISLLHSIKAMLWMAIVNLLVICMFIPLLSVDTYNISYDNLFCKS